MSQRRDVLARCCKPAASFGRQVGARTSQRPRHARTAPPLGPRHAHADPVPAGPRLAGRSPDDPDAFPRHAWGHHDPARGPAGRGALGLGRGPGAAGLRDGAHGFFSQVYLDRPVARLLAERSGRKVRDADILEVVSMACPRPIATLPLIEAIAAEGRLRGKTWGLFTATAALVALLQRTGVPLLPLAPARSQCLPDAACWGRYYETDPWVCALQERAEPLRFMPRPSRAPHKVSVR
nr:thermostable hemolysin [Paracoccus gahaiensis]